MINNLQQENLAKKNDNHHHYYQRKSSSEEIKEVVTSTVNIQSVESMYPHQHSFMSNISADPLQYDRLMMVQQRYMQEHHPPNNFESPWEDEDHPENYSPTLDEYADRQDKIPHWEDENQRENYPVANNHLQEESDESQREPLSVLLAILHDGDEEELNDSDGEFVRVREMSFLEESERLYRGSNLKEETTTKHLKTRQYRPLADEDGDGDGEICVVCQSDFEHEEILAKLECGHEYHPDCITRWLQHKNVCPICKRTAIDRDSS